MVCVAVNGKPVIGVIHKPFEGKTYWGWVGHEVSQNLQENNSMVCAQSGLNSLSTFIVRRLLRLNLTTSPSSSPDPTREIKWRSSSLPSSPMQRLKQLVEQVNIMG